MPIEGLDLRVHPSYDYAERFAKAFPSKPVPTEDDDGVPIQLRSQFWSSRWRTTVGIVERAGRCHAVLLGNPHHAGQLLETLSAADAWGVPQELRAMELLGSLIAPRQYRQYFLTGMFMEKSRRSRVHYLFRRLRPTLAIVENGNDMRILTALCLHPIAYYDGSWAGAMCPTDDVVAHLMLMRGDEHMFWKRSNQHPPHHHAAGI